MAADKPQQYRKKPVVIFAMQWTGDNFSKIEKWARGFRAIRPDGDSIKIETLEGVMRANLGDWIIMGVKGEVYPCKPDIFEATYEPA